MRRLGLAVAAVSLVVPMPARADVSLHALLETHLGVTDNVTSAAEGSTRTNDGFLMLRPGFLVSYETRRTQHELTASSDLNLYAANTDSFAMSAHGRYLGTYLLTPFTTGELGASVGSGTVTDLGARAPAGDGQPMVLPTGGTRFSSATGEERLAHQLGEATSVYESGFGRWVTTEVDGAMGESSTSSFEFGGSIGGERSWRVTSFGVEARASLVSLGVTEPGMPQAIEEQLDVTGVGVARRDLSRRWTARAEGGVTRVIPVGDTGEPITEPTFAAAIIYNPEWATGSLEARHAVQPNLFLAANTITDSLVANAALPLPWLSEHRAEPRLTALFTVGGLRTRFISLETGELSNAILALSVDAAVAWTPKDNLALSARLQFVRQSEDNTGGMGGELDLTRTALLLTFSGRWPERVAAESRGRRENRRVDRSNIVPIGDEDER
jgi:hypothetical protein